MAAPNYNGKNANRYRKVYPFTRDNPLTISIASASDNSDFTNAGWRIFRMASSDIAASQSYDPNTILSGGLAQSGSYQMIVLQTPTTGINPNQGYVVHHDLRNMFGTGISSGSFSPQKLVNLMIQHPRAATTPLPSGTYAFMMLTDGHMSGATKGFGIMSRNDTGTGLRAYAVALVGSAYTLSNATTDSVGLKSVISAIYYNSNTQQHGLNAIPLDNSGGQIGGAANMGVDISTRANASGLTTLAVGFGWVSGSAGTLAAVTASFKAFVQSPFEMKSGSIDI